MGMGVVESSSEIEPLVYMLDRRGPNDRRFNSVHVVVVVMATLLVAAAIVVL